MATTPSQQPPAAAERRETPRIHLARLASAAALADPDVGSLDAGPAGLQATFAGAERLPGVIVNPEGDGHAVALYLAATPTDLHALGERVGAAVRKAAAAGGLANALTSVHVTVTDLLIPDPLPRA